MSTCSTFPSLANGKWRVATSPSTIPPVPCCSWDFPHANKAWCTATPSIPVRAGDELHRGSEGGAASGGFACTCKSHSPSALEWSGDCQLPKWNASRFCELLGGRRVLFVGDSTMQQTAAVLMSAIAWHYHVANGGNAHTRAIPSRDAQIQVFHWKGAP